MAEDRYEEEQLVKLQHNLPELSLCEGDVGTVVYIYEEREIYEVEFYTFGGELIAVLTLEPDQIGTLNGHDTLHARHWNGAQQMEE